MSLVGYDGNASTVAATHACLPKLNHPLSQVRTVPNHPVAIGTTITGG
jgi:hypothetical protein